MKLLRNIALILLLFGGTAAAQTCPANVTTVGGQVSCWVPPANGTTIADLTDSNPVTIATDSTYALQSGNTLGCGTASSTTPTSITSGCDLTTGVSYSPAALTIVMKFSGTGGPLAQFASQSSVSAPFEYYELYLDSSGRISWGAQNYGALNVLQGPSQKILTDGNPHIVVASLGGNGMRLYIDGSLVESNNITLANYSAGYWLFGNANLASAGAEAWPNAPAQSWFNGTLYYWAWWNSQLSDAQAQALSNPGTNPPSSITNNYVNVTGQIASYAISQGFAYANQGVTFHSEQSQLPACGSSIPIAPSSQTYYTDSQGNLPSNVTLPQGAHLTMTIQRSSVPLVMPCQSTIGLSTLLPAQTPLPDAVSQVNVAGPLYQGTSVSNPAVGTVGPATLTSPGTINNTCSGTVTIDRSLGPQQTCTLSAPTTITFANFLDGGPGLALDVITDGNVNDVPTWPSTVVWPGGVNNPPSPNTLAGTHNFYSFQNEGGTIYGVLSQTPNGGTFPLSGTADFNNFSGIDIGGLQLVKQPAPSNFTATSACSGTCATTYTYEVTCLTGYGESPTLPNGTADTVTATNAATLSNSNNVTLSWTQQPQCATGYNIYGRIGGNLGLLASLPSTTTTFVDNGSIANPANIYTFSFPVTTYPAVTIWDLKNAALTTPVDAFSTQVGNLTNILTMPALTTSTTNDTQFAVYGVDRGAGTFTGPTGFTSTVTVQPAASVNFGLGIAQKNIATASTIALQSTARTVNRLNSAQLNIAIEAANPAVPITLGNSTTVTATSPFNQVTFTDPSGTATGDLELVCVAFQQGTITAPSPPAQFQLISSVIAGQPGKTGSSTSVQLNCYFNVPNVSALPPPPTANTTGSITQTTPNGQTYNEILLGLTAWGANSGAQQNGAAASAPMASITFPVQMTVQSCRATWTGYATCSQFPTFALKDTTQNIVLCSSGQVNSSPADGFVAANKLTLPANDVLAFLATTVGNGCTAGAVTSMNIGLHQ